MCRSTCGGQRTIYRSWFCLLPCVELRLSGLAAMTLPVESSPLPPFVNVPTYYKSIQIQSLLEEQHMTSCQGRSMSSLRYPQVFGILGALQTQSSRKFMLSSLWRPYWLNYSELLAPGDQHNSQPFFSPVAR